MLAMRGVAQPLSSPEDLWRAIAALPAGQLRTILDIDRASPGPTADLDSFRRRIARVFGNVAGFASSAPPEPIVREMWEKYRG